MYSTANRGQTVCARNNLGRPLFQSDSFLTMLRRRLVGRREDRFRDIFHINRRIDEMGIGSYLMIIER